MLQIKNIPPYPKEGISIPKTKDPIPAPPYVRTSIMLATKERFLLLANVTGKEESICVLMVEISAEITPRHKIATGAEITSTHRINAIAPHMKNETADTR